MVLTVLATPRTRLAVPVSVDETPLPTSRIRLGVCVTVVEKLRSNPCPDVREGVPVNVAETARAITLLRLATPVSDVAIPRPTSRMREGDCVNVVLRVEPIPVVCGEDDVLKVRVVDRPLPTPRIVDAASVIDTSRKKPTARCLEGVSAIDVLIVTG